MVSAQYTVLIYDWQDESSSPFKHLLKAVKNSTISRIILMLRQHTQSGGFILTTIEQIESINQLRETLQQQSYIADKSLTTAIYLSLKLGKPLFLEGEAGVGKTEIAKV